MIALVAVSKIFEDLMIEKNNKIRTKKLGLSVWNHGLAGTWATSKIFIYFTKQG